MSACLRGDLNETILADKYDDARRLAYTYRDIFGKDNFFLEIQDHGLEQDKRLTPQVNRLSHRNRHPARRHQRLPLSAPRRRPRARNPDVHPDRQDHVAIPNRMHWDHPDFYLKIARRNDGSSSVNSKTRVNRPWEIAQRCHVKLEKVKDPFPRFDIPADHTTDSYFAYVARQGFEKRRPRLEAMRAAGSLKHDLAEYVERLDFEIAMIQQMKFSGYFLIVWDFIRYAKSKNIPVGPGRGSAAGSLVSYAMQITDIDPLQYGLLFERFLNPERISMPDIDIDFCMNRRGEVIQYVTEKYGREQVAQIITFNTLGARAAIKDVGRVLDMSFADVDKHHQARAQRPEHQAERRDRSRSRASTPGRSKTRACRKCSTWRTRLEGFARNSSVHAAGVVISPEPLKNLVPLYRTNREEIVTQYDMNGLDKLALLKMDFLGPHHADAHRRRAQDDREAPRRAASCPKICRSTIPAPTRSSAKVSPAASSSSNRRACATFCAATSPAASKTSPRSTRSIVPARSGRHDRRLHRAQARPQGRPYDLPELKEILEETYGVILYQEQVMQISSRVAGYSLGDADILRRAMGKKKVEEMAQAARALRQGRAGARPSGRRRSRRFST